MKIITILTLFFITTSTPIWLNNFEEARHIALAKKELILLNFSGSDWCGPCIRTRKEIFETDAFQNFAEKNLVLVNADFPRSSKNKLSKEQVKLNEALADRFNINGIFPLTILLDADGKIVKQWEGFPDVKPEIFIEQIKKYNNAAN